MPESGRRQSCGRADIANGFLNEHTGKDGAPIAVRQITADMSPQEAAQEYARSLEADDA